MKRIIELFKLTQAQHSLKKKTDLILLSILSFCIVLTVSLNFALIHLARQQSGAPYLRTLLVSSEYQKSFLEKAALVRAYLLFGDDTLKKEIEIAHRDNHALFEKFKSALSDMEGLPPVEGLSRAEESHSRQLELLLDFIEKNKNRSVIRKQFEKDTYPKWLDLQNELSSLIKTTDAMLQQRAGEARERRQFNLRFAQALIGFCPILLLILAFTVRTSLKKRKLSELALELGQTFFDSVFNQNAFGIAFISADGTLEDCSDKFGTHIGQIKAYIAGKTIFDFIHPEDRGKWQQLLREIQTVSKKTASLESRFVDGDGGVHFISACVTWARPDEGSLGYIFILTEDTSLHRREEMRLRNERISLENSLLSADSATWSWNIETDEVSASPTQNHIFGSPLKSQAWDVNDFFDKIHPEDRESIRSQIEDTVKTGKEYVARFRTIWPDGSIHWLADRGRLVRDDSGKAIRMEGVISNIDEQKKNEQELERYRETIKNAHRMESIGRLASGTAHEFNNLLSAVLGYTLLLKDKTQVDGENYKFLSLIEESAEHGARLVRQLLDFSQRRSVELKAIAIRPVIERVCDLLRAISRKSSIQISFSCSDDLPMMNGDVDSLIQIFVNLGLNSIDAFEANSQEKNIQFEAKKQIKQGKTWLELTVRDNGMGMAEEVKNRIFDPFFTTKQPGAGTGLGLSTAYGLVRVHRGEIEVESQLNVGTTFHIRFPAELSLGTQTGIEGDRAALEGVPPL